MQKRIYLALVISFAALTVVGIVAYSVYSAQGLHAPAYPECSWTTGRCDLVLRWKADMVLYGTLLSTTFGAYFAILFRLKRKEDKDALGPRYTGG